MHFFFIIDDLLMLRVFFSLLINMNVHLLR